MKNDKCGFVSNESLLRCRIGSWKVGLKGGNKGVRVVIIKTGYDKQRHYSASSDDSLYTRKFRETFH